MGAENQSPAAKRGNQQDYGQFSKGEVQWPSDRPSKVGGVGNEHASELQDTPNYTNHGTSGKDDLKGL